MLACTDKNTDIGRIIVNGGFGWWSISSDISRLKQRSASSRFKHTQYEERGFEYLMKKYTADKGYKIIMKRLK